MESATAAYELREARMALGLSQGRVARDTRIHRSQLSLFETRKLLLDRAQVSSLRAYYSKRGYRFHEPNRAINPDPPARGPVPDELTPSDLKILDGFAVAGAIERARAEAWLDQIAANDEVIDELLAVPASFDPWKFDSHTEERDEAMLQMARNYVLVRRLHGRELLPLPRSNKDPKLTGDLVRELFWGKDYTDQLRVKTKLKTPQPKPLRKRKDKK